MIDFFSDYDNIHKNDNPQDAVNDKPQVTVNDKTKNTDDKKADFENLGETVQILINEISALKKIINTKNTDPTSNNNIDNDNDKNKNEENKE